MNSLKTKDKKQKKQISRNACKFVIDTCNLLMQSIALFEVGFISRFSVIVDKIDMNKDGFVDLSELKAWIQFKEDKENKLQIIFNSSYIPILKSSILY